MIIFLMLAFFLGVAMFGWLRFLGIHRSLESYGKEARRAARLTMKAEQKQDAIRKRFNAAESRTTSLGRIVQDQERRSIDAARRQEYSERNFKDMTLRAEEMERRQGEAESAFQANAQRKEQHCRDLERRADETLLRLNEGNRELEARRQDSAVADEEITRKKEEASEAIATWLQTETAHLTQRLNDQYADELANMKKDLAEKTQFELDKVQTYFLEFAKNKTSLAGGDIQGFVDAQLS